MSCCKNNCDCIMIDGLILLWFGDKKDTLYNMIKRLLKWIKLFRITITIYLVLLCVFLVWLYTKNMDISHFFTIFGALGTVYGIFYNVAYNKYIGRITEIDNLTDLAFEQIDNDHRFDLAGKITTYELIKLPNILYIWKILSYKPYHSEYIKYPMVDGKLSNDLLKIEYRPDNKDRPYVMKILNKEVKEDDYFVSKVDISEEDANIYKSKYNNLAYYICWGKLYEKLNIHAASITAIKMKIQGVIQSAHKNQSKNIKGLYLGELFLQDIELYSVYLPRVSFVYSDLSLSDLRSSDLYHTNLAFCKLIKATLSYAAFTECNLLHSSFLGADLLNATFDNCIIEDITNVNNYKKYNFVDLVLKVKSKKEWFEARLPDFNGIIYLNSITFSKDIDINNAVRAKIKKIFDMNTDIDDKYLAALLNKNLQ